MSSDEAQLWEDTRAMFSLCCNKKNKGEPTKYTLTLTDFIVVNVCFIS